MKGDTSTMQTEKIRQTTAMYRTDRGGSQPGRGTGRSRNRNSRRDSRRRAVPAGLPLHAAAKLDERSQRDGVLQGRLPPLLPAQSVRQPVGQHVLGPRNVTDLVHWKEQPLAIATDDQQDIFSGSVVVDKDNTSGLGHRRRTRPWWRSSPAPTRTPRPTGTAGPVPGVQHGRGQTWTKYSGNPVLNRDSAKFRDPKVFWYDAPAGGGYWVMAAVEATEHKVVLYKSGNLKDWTQLSEFGPANATGGLWECPDLFPLAVDGDPRNVKWVMVVNTNPGGVAGGSGGQYFVGKFDGTTFTSETTKASDALPAGTPGRLQRRHLQRLDREQRTRQLEGRPVRDARVRHPRRAERRHRLCRRRPDQFIQRRRLAAGLVSSPEFTVDSDYLNFLVGGGQHPRVSDNSDNTPPPGDLLFNGFEVPDGSTLADAGWTGTGDLAAGVPAFHSPAATSISAPSASTRSIRAGRPATTGREP